MDKMLYFCDTPYHVLISILKQYANPCHADMLLARDFPGGYELVERIAKENIFKSVELLTNPVVQDGSSKFMDYFLVKGNCCQSESLKEKLAQYNDLFLFNDLRKFGFFLNHENIPYHLIEDGFDCFALWDQSKPWGRFAPVKRFLHNAIGLPVGLGQGPNIIDLEVNDRTRLITPLSCRVIEKRRSELYQIPNESQVEQLFRIFDAEPLYSVAHDSCVILSDPLPELGVTRDDQASVELFLKMAEVIGFDSCYIKPHPRDCGDYFSCFPKERVIPSFLPIELLNFLGKDRIALAATWNSTAIHGLTCCRRKVVFDPNNTDPRVEHMSLMDRHGGSCFDGDDAIRG